MSAEIEVRPAVLDELVLLLRECASSLAGLRSLGPAPDAGASSGEVERMLRQVENSAAALARRVSSVADRVTDTRDCYVDVDDRVRRLLSGLSSGDGR